MTPGRPPGRAREIIAEYSVRRPVATPPDAAWQYQVTVLGDLLELMEVVLQDSRIPQPVIDTVIRAMLYGRPGLADAQLRIEQDRQVIIAARAGQLPGLPYPDPGAGADPPR